MIITCYLNRGGVRGLGLPIFDVRCINFHKPPQEGLPFSSIHVLEGLLGVPLMCCQEPPIESAVLMGAFVSATGLASSASVHGEGLLVALTM